MLKFVMPVGVMAALALSACGSSTTTPSGGGAQAVAPQAPVEETSAPAPVEETAPAPPPKPEAHVLFSASTPSTVHSDTFTIRGKATPGSKVTVRQGSKFLTATQHGRKWSVEVTVHMGDNTLNARVIKKGFVTGRDLIVVTRRHSAAELAAERAEREASFKANAQTIDYSQLIKDPSQYKGTKAKIYGQIFQIQQDGSYGGIMLVSVTDMGYGYWDDNIWVDYDGRVGGAEGDMITIYGRMTGSKSYETQAGGETYVPRMRAKYIDE